MYLTLSGIVTEVISQCETACPYIATTGSPLISSGMTICSANAASEPFSTPLMIILLFLPFSSNSQLYLIPFSSV